MRIISIFVSLLLLLGLSSCSKKQQQSNVILIMTDDQGYGDLGCHGSPYVKTPCLDKLYEESVRFTDFHVDPCCAPTRSALLTGCYSSRAGVWHTIGGMSLAGSGIYLTRDGGESWENMGLASTNTIARIVIDPDNTDYLLNANDGGVYVSYDGGANWNCWLDNLPAVTFFNVNYDMRYPFRVYGSIQDYGSMYGVVDLSRGRDKISPMQFEWAPGGEGCSHFINPEDPDEVFSAGFYGRIQRTDMGEDDNWRTRTKALLPNRYQDEPGLRGQWVAPFILSPHNPDIVYHGMQYLMMSRDRGDTWEYISPDLTYNDKDMTGDISYQTLFSISESPLKFGLIYAGTDDGRLHRTKDGGKT